jgi:hypothetical protein
LDTMLWEATARMAVHAVPPVVQVCEIHLDLHLACIAAGGPHPGRLYVCSVGRSLVGTQGLSRIQDSGEHMFDYGCYRTAMEADPPTSNVRSITLSKVTPQRLRVRPSPASARWSRTVPTYGPTPSSVMIVRVSGSAP